MPPETVSCEPVWKALESIKHKLTEEEYNRLCDLFCDFECSWDEHATEYHSDEADNG